MSGRTTLHRPKIPTTTTPVVTTPTPRSIPSPWNCYGWGDPHYKTFDGFRYDFQGDCKYSLVRDINGSFEIEVKNFRAFHFIASSVSVTKYADVYIGNDVIRLGPGINVKVNSTKVTLLPHNSEFYSIDVSGSSIQFNCPVLSLNVVFNFGISVSLGEQWRNKVDGLCKNFDGNLTNDQSDASGTDISGQRNKGTLLGNSYQVLDPEEPKCKSSLTEDLPDTCKNDMAKKEAKDVCESVVNPTGPFAECIKRLSKEFLQDFVEDCMVDYCDNPENGCNIVSKFAEETCTREGVDIPIWRDDFGCKMECAENEEYLPNGPGCETKCLEKEQTFCNTLNREGCFCKTGYIRCEGKCVDNKEFRGSWLGSFDCNNVTYNVRVDITNVGGSGDAPEGVLHYWNTDAMIDGSHELKGVLSRNTFTMLGFNWIRRPTGQKAFFVLSQGEFNDEEQTFSAEFQSYNLCISERTTLYRGKSK
ncbi:unnamed protein product [Owenia fusiformis]|uniref:VWFD domain-containing protein n=1 Tax=Owenia fusiformis TaxID=6347 RepID=A0A8S4P084_OWEFU|nr:unnamed protein product [Owenia fusiformis]